MKTKTFPRGKFSAAIITLLMFILTLGPASLTRAAGSIGLTTLETPYTQDFDSLASSGTSSTVPNGWDFAESGTNANTMYTAGTGSSNTGDTYSFGASGSSERAFGGLLSGSLVPTIGASFTNDTGSVINQLTIAYTGEQWRSGATGRTDGLDFQLSTDATSLTTGTWINYDALDFSSPNNTITGALDGNAAANRTPISFTITGLNIADGSTFWIRWTDFNASGADDGLAVDDFSLTPEFVTTPTAPSGVGSADPANVAPGGSTLLTVAVTPGTNPTSTGLTVTANLTAIGESAAQPFFDDGSNGDVTADDNTFSYQATVDSATTPGDKDLPVTIADAQGRMASTSISLTVEEPAVPAGTIVISQVYGGGGNSGATYTHDFIELYNRGASDVDITGWSVQYASAAGTTWQVTSLSGVISSGGYYLVQQAQGAGGTTPLPTPDAIGAIAMSATNGKVALVSNSTGLSGACPSGASIVDFVGYGSTASCFEGSAPTATLSNTTAALRKDGGATDTDDNAADFEVGAPNPRNSGFDSGEEPELGNCSDPATFIHEIQGSGPTSPLVGQTAIIEGVVAGDFQAGDGDAFNSDLGGFYVQEEDGDADADPLTSEGIFVLDGSSGVDVALGNVVRVQGIVAESFSRTQLGSVTDVVVCSSGHSVTPATVTLPVNSLNDLEAYEGMSVVIPQTLYISEYFNFDRFGEIVLTTERQFQPTAVVEPGSAANALADAHELARITLDDGRSSQNPDPAIHPNGNVFNLDNLFRGDDTVQDVTGVMDFAFGLYRIQPTEGADYSNENPRTAAPEDVGGNLKVASFNVLNYFTTIDTGAFICGPAGNQECRGADNAEEFTRQRDKIIAALVAMDADVVGLIEIENHPGDVPTADLVSGLNDMMGAGTYDYIATGAIGSDAIRLAFIYKPASVSLVGAYAVLDSSVDPRFLDDFNRPVLAQTFQDNSTGGIFTVAVNHLKSKGSDCNAIGDPDTGDGQGNCNLTRKAAAEALVDWLATDPTGSGDADFLIIGDLNAYDKEDPIDAIREGADDDLGTGDDYTDLIFKYQGEFAYSYLFDGQLGYLDHALAIGNLLSQITGTTVWHINADEPDILDYDTSFKQDAQDALYQPNAYRSSDHDPVIVGLDLNGSPDCSAAAPSVASLWPPDHRFVPITVQGVTDPEGDPITITIDSIFQDEAVDAPDSGNTAPDGQGVGTDTAEVRAERVGTSNGRVYHITFTARDNHGGSCTAIVLVGVPISINTVAVDNGPLFDSTEVP